MVLNSKSDYNRGLTGTMLRTYSRPPKPTAKTRPVLNSTPDATANLRLKSSLGVKTVPTSKAAKPKAIPRRVGGCSSCGGRRVR